jgi:hypothetical protein
LTTPGFRGLNTQLSSGTLGPEWATDLRNAVIDDNGRVAARKGWNSLTSIPAPYDFVHVIEYVRSNGSTTLIGVTASGFYESTTGDTWTNITGSVPMTTGEWQMVNFNNQVYAASPGKAMVYYTGTGTFQQITDVNAPTGGVIMSGFGRLWATSSDGHTVKYSALLDGTDWTSVDNAGVVDHWNVWPGNDQIVAMSSFNGVWVVFGRQSIIMWTDGRGSQLGIDPLTMYVVDIVTGVGCLSKYAMQQVEGDLWFLSDNGIQSLGRVIQQRTSPLDNVSMNVQDYLRDAVYNTDFSLIRSVYSPKDRLFLLSLPDGGSTEAGQAIVFDTRGKFEDGSSRCMGVWKGFVPRAAVVKRDGKFLSTLASTTGELGEYYGEVDDGDAYLFYYETGWFDLTKGYLLLPKRYTGVVFSSGAIDVTFRWAFDFDLNWNALTKTFDGNYSGGEWGVDEWGIAEFGGNLSLRQGKVAASGSGKYIKLSIQSTIDNSSLALQQLDLFFKIGRLA